MLGGGNGSGGGAEAGDAPTSERALMSALGYRWRRALGSSPS